MKEEFDALFAEHQKLLGELQAMRAVAQPEQKPLLLIQSHRDGYWCVDLTCKKCYAADFRFKHTPPQRTWVGLTDAEVKKNCWLRQIHGFTCGGCKNC